MRSSLRPLFWSSVVSAMAIAGTAVMTGAQVRADESTAPTFTKDIAPIFQQKCDTCHRPSGMAPMSLETYQDARPFVRSIAQKVEARQMPPWNIDKTVGIQNFKNDRSLSDDQIATISKWIAGGAPMGDPRDMPAPVVWPSDQGWAMAAKYGPPDLTVKSTPWTVPAESQDAWWRPEVPTGLTEARWVRAIEIRPTSVEMRKVTHHALARLEQKEDATMPKELFTNDPNVAGDGLFMEWAVGKNADEMRPDSGRLMLPGSKILWEIHYHAIGEEVKDAQVELAVWFYPKGQEPKHREVLALFNAFSGSVPGGRGLDLPPNTVTTTESFIPLKQNARIENFQVHEHLRGKGMSMEAIFPDGRRQMLSQVTDFNFNWMNMYIYADDSAPLLPKGTILHLVAWYDNTSANKSNPDPDQWVGYGDRTVDEMGHAWLNITYYDDEDFKAELAKRAALTSKNTQQQ
jgi:mono/diheme cytochrome c family protein